MRNFNLGHRETLSWPMTQTQLDNLGETLLVSPRVGNSHGYQSPSEAVYTYQVQQIPALREDVDGGIWPTAYLQEHLGSDQLSPLLEKYLGLLTVRPDLCADIVRMDHPYDLWDLVIEPYIADEGISVATAFVHAGNPFVELANIRGEVHKKVGEALDKAFDVKYAFGVCRPTEFYDPNLQRFETPNHPESPAGHGSFSGATAKAFETYFLPTQPQIDAVQFATKQFAMFRSFSAMHIPYSNLLGWQIGYESF